MDVWKCIMNSCCLQLLLFTYATNVSFDSYDLSHFLGIDTNDMFYL